MAYANLSNVSLRIYREISKEGRCINMEQTMWNIWFGAMAVLFVSGIVGRIYENDFEKKFGRSLFHPSAIVAVFLVSMGAIAIGIIVLIRIIGDALNKNNRG